MTQAGKIVGGIYQITDLISISGDTRVLEARDTTLDRMVRLKMRPNSEGDVTLLEEARALAAIEHPCVPAVYSIGVHDKWMYLATERIFGVTLAAHMADKLAQRDLIDAASIVDILLSLCEAIGAVHEVGFGHGSVTAESITLTNSGRLVFTEIAPLRGTESEDLYAMGSIGYELLTALQPHKIVPPDELCDLIGELVAPDVARRPRSVFDARDQLVAIKTRLATPDRPLNIAVVHGDVDTALAIASWARRADPHTRVQVLWDAEAVIDRFAKNPPDLLVLGLNDLPGMNALELCMYLRGTGNTEHCTIIPVCANAAPQDIEVLSQLGVSRFAARDDELGIYITEAVRSMSRALRLTNN